MFCVQHWSKDYGKTYGCNYGEIFLDDEPPSVIVTEDDGSVWYGITDYCDENSEYYHLGIAPKPDNKLRWMIWHICMGMLSQYPLFDIAKFVFKDLFIPYPDYSDLPNAEYEVIFIEEIKKP